MPRIIVHIKVDEIQGSHVLNVIKKNTELFVANPHADMLDQSALVQLDPKRIADSPDFLIPMNYRGLLLDIRSRPRA